MERHLVDIITCAKFQGEIFRGYNVTGVDRISHFSYSFCVGLTTAALHALPVISSVCMDEKRVQISVKKWNKNEEKEHAQ